MANDGEGFAPTPEILAAARGLIPKRGGDIESVTIGASGMGGRSVTLTAEDGERFDRARAGTDEPPDPNATFGVPTRRDFVDPLYIQQGGNPDSDYAPLLDFLPAPEIAAVAARVIAKYPRRFRHLLPPINQRVDYLWKRTGGESAGKSILGKCVKAGTLAKHYLRQAIDQRAIWVIWIAADHCQFGSQRQMEGLVFHELLHTGLNEKLKPKVQPHDVEEFRAVIELYGFIFDDLRALKETVMQRSLFDGEGGEEGGEQEESE